MAEEELPEELDKLQITPPMAAQAKLLLDSDVQLLNPFFNTDGKAHNTQVGGDGQHHRVHTSPTRPSNCHRCRLRRASESVLLEEKKYSKSSNQDTEDCVRTPSSGVAKQSLKKYTSSSAGSGSRKLLLREPVLKALQTCMHPQSNVRRKLIPSVVSAGAQTFDFNQSSESGPIAASKGMSDFRDLIEECRNLLTEDVDFSGRLHQICLSNRNSKNFTTMQTPQTPNNSKLRNHRTYQKQKVISRESIEGENGGCATDLKYDNPHNLNSLAQPPLNTQRSSSSTTASPDHATSSVRCNTSCSQQAGSTTAATAPSDDVTIDELASYFDTFVHIPKKMSSMAEMMYI